MGAIGLSLVPIVSMAGMPIVYNAMMATGVMMGGLAAIALNSPAD